jgi:hypothetical protein
MAREEVLKVTVHDEELRRWFDYAGYKVRDARDPFARVAEEIIRLGIETQFVTEGARSGGWEPLAFRTRQERALQGFGAGHPILERTGAMKSDLLDPDAFIVTRERLRYSPRSVEQMAMYQKSYANYHQEIQTRDDGSITPARPWLVWLPEDNHRMEEIFEDWLDDLRFENRARPNVLGIFGAPNLNVMFL